LLNKKFRWQDRASPDADIYRPFRAFIFLRKNFTESDANGYKVKVCDATAAK